MIIKKSRDLTQMGFLDPTVLARTKEKALITDEVLEEKINLADVDFLQTRNSMGKASEDLSDGTVTAKGMLIPAASRYLPALYVKPKGGQIDKCLVYLHGGGFIGGKAETMKNQCLLIAQKAHCAVISLDYRLAPETPFPGAYDDVCEAVAWISANHQSLGFSDQQVILAGDSAGGNLALVCGLNDKQHLIKRVISVYGALDLVRPQDALYDWRYDLYQMAPEQKKYIHSRLNVIAHLANIMRELYPGQAEITNPNVSPVYGQDFSNLPPTTFIEAEFDFYLLSNQYLAKKIRQHGAQADEIWYQGMDHGFFERLGSAWQAEDVCNEIAQIIGQV